MRQDQDPVSIYFTKLEAIWEELNQFRPVCSFEKCTCDGVKNLDIHIQNDYTMTFLMGLNKSFAQIRSQVLLLDPLPPINRVFSLVVQEKKHRTVENQYNLNASANVMDFALKEDQPQSHHNS